MPEESLVAGIDLRLRAPVEEGLVVRIHADGRLGHGRPEGGDCECGGQCLQLSVSSLLHRLLLPS
jgi:hypothetical protein